MSYIKNFLENLDFSFEKDIFLKEMEFFENNKLTKKLDNNVFVYNSPENTNSSFYLITVPNLTNDEIFEIRKYIWNEDKYDFYFYTENSNIISLYYAKTNPIENKIKSKIDSFKGIDEDVEKIEKIRKWNFQTGAFWLSYSNFLDKVKKSERVDKKLIERLTDLKKELLSELGNEKKKEVQSLIDRTLFIKFLEDNHIINSVFYKHYFNNENLSYKELLNRKDALGINQLYGIINEIFDNILFTSPKIEKQYIISASDFIYRTISGEIKGQLSLFDFRFDIIPIEFISHIYEVFLEDKQANEGIYYTPPKLAQLIIDDTITKNGKVLDPACGSGMFLILAFRNILEKSQSKKNQSVSEKIKTRINLLKKYIFGIEKQYTAWRLTIFSLYLEILKDIPANEITEYIKQRIENGNIKIFADFSDNIRCGNSLEIKKENSHFTNQTFDFIVGNPPFFQISKKDNEIEFINHYKTTINGKEYRAKDIIGDKQISQAFMLKIKDWANANTKFGFVLNSSNFYNEYSKAFRKFYFENYQIENFYELSGVKNILFTAGEPVVVAIFNNKKIENNIIKYYPVDLEFLSKIFKLLIIKKDRRIDIKQKNIVDNKIELRELLIGNEFDLDLIQKLKNNFNLLKEYILDDNYYGLAVGIRVTGSDKIEKENVLYRHLSEKEKKVEFKKIKQSYISDIRTKEYNIPYIEYKDINAFEVKINKFLRDDDLINKRYRRNKKLTFFEGNKILLRKIPKKIFEAIYDNQILCFPDGVFSIRLNNNYYHLITSLFNSYAINYFVHLSFLKRISGSFPHISKKVIKNIPIPKVLDQELVVKISQISKQLTEGKLKYEGKIKEKLNELIYDLYDLSYLERQRIKDYFAPPKMVERDDLERYKETLLYTLEMHFENKPKIGYSIDKTFGFNLLVVGIYFTNNKKMPGTEKVLKYEITEILQKSEESLLAMREVLFGNDCIYIIKDNQFKNWSETKAFEDGKFILKKLS
jgi:type I restriction-modification system DNA methylase subunit